MCLSQSSRTNHAVAVINAADRAKTVDKAADLLAAVNEAAEAAQTESRHKQ
jgi:hypothetical protein